MAFKRSAVRSRLNGIQEVSGSIPLISTRRIMKGLISSEIKPFCFPQKMNIGMMLATSTAVQASSLLLKKAVSTNQEIVKAAFFRCPEMCLTVRHNELPL